MKFKVGDILRPVYTVFGPTLAHLTVTVVYVREDDRFLVHWSDDPSPKETFYDDDDFILSEEAIIDRILEKYK